MCDYKGKTFIATLHSVLLAPNISAGLFFIITLMNLGHSCLFNKGFYEVYFGSKEKMWLPYHIVHKGNMYFCKEKKVQKIRNYHLGRKLVYNCCTRD